MHNAAQNGVREITGNSTGTVGLPVIFDRERNARSAADSPQLTRRRTAGRAGGRSTNPDREAAWLEDAALVERARVDPEAFGSLYDRYCDQIFRFTYRRLPDRESAEDVTAEVFFKALRAIDAYQPTVAPFSAWLYRIAANAVTDYLRARRVPAPLEAVVEQPDRADPVDEQAMNRVEADRVWAAVDRLTDAQRTAVILRLGHDLPIAEIAAMMERSEGAVKLLLNRGLTAVRGYLDVGSGKSGRRRGSARGDEEAPR